MHGKALYPLLHKDSLIGSLYHGIFLSLCLQVKIDHRASLGLPEQSSLTYDTTDGAIRERKEGRNKKKQWNAGILIIIILVSSIYWIRWSFMVCDGLISDSLRRLEEHVLLQMMVVYDY